MMDPIAPSGTVQITGRSSDGAARDAVGPITLVAMRRFGARAGTLAGLAMGVGMVAATAAFDHTTPSFTGFNT